MIPRYSYTLLWIPMDSHRIPIDSYVFVWVPSDSHEFLWIAIELPMDSINSHRLI